MAQALASMEDDHAARMTQSVQRTIKVEPILRLPSPPRRAVSPPALPTLGLIFKTLHHKRLYHVSYRRCYNYFRFILTDGTYLCGAWTLPTACRLTFATLG